MRFLIIVTALLTLLPPQASADVIQLDSERLIVEWAKHDTNCRGALENTDDTWVQCGARDAIASILDNAGYCWGPGGAATAKWHKCK